MKTFEWISKRITDADYFVQFTLEEIRVLDNVFPDVSSKCREVGGFYYGFVDLKLKRFIPLKNPVHAFGGCYIDYPPYGKQELEVDFDLTQLSWQEDVDMDLERDRSDWSVLDHEAKNRQLFFQQKKTLDTFLERGAISQAQYDKSLHDLTVKMGMEGEV